MDVLVSAEVIIETSGLLMLLYIAGCKETSRLWGSARVHLSGAAQEKTIVSTFVVMKSQSPRIESPKIHQTSSDVP